MQPHRKRQWCIAKLTASFLAQMELILRLYLLPYSEDYPVVCFDERPCFLIGNLVKGLDMQPGQVEKENYSYSKHGSCCVLAAIEPKTEKRLAQVLNRRIPIINELSKEVLIYFKERSDNGVKIEWQFSQEKAREKLKRHYHAVNSLNPK